MKLETYRINDDVYLVEGGQRDAVYDLKSGNVFSINNKAKKIVLETRRNEQFYVDLVDRGLINYRFTPEIVAGKDDVTPQLSFLWCEVTKRCNLKCVHCYNGDLDKTDSLLKPDFCGLTRRVNEGFEAGADRIQFIGGEPFMLNPILELAKFAKEKGYSFVEIFTNATKISQNDIYRIKELGLNMAISLYSNIAEIHDKVTQVSGSFVKTKRTMDRLREANVPTRIGVVVTKINQETIESTLRMIRDYGFGGGDGVDIVRLIGRSSVLLLPDRDIIKKYGISSKPSFVTNKESFENNRRFNPCWGGKVAVRSDLSITPCIMEETQVAGKEVSIMECMNSERLNMLWGITKDEIDGCGVCEYRYACGDCRVIAKAETGSLYGKTPRCSYNPNTGIWC